MLTEINPKPKKIWILCSLVLNQFEGLIKTSLSIKHQARSPKKRMKIIQKNHLPFLPELHLVQRQIASRL